MLLSSKNDESDGYKTFFINFAKHFQNFIDDTMIWFLNSKLDLNLSCAKDFLNLISLVTWCINWRRLLALIMFQRSSLKLFQIIKRLAITLMYCKRLHAWWSTQSRLATLLSSLIARRGSDFRLYDGTIIESEVGEACLINLRGSDFRLYDGSALKTYLLMRW